MYWSKTGSCSTNVSGGIIMSRLHEMKADGITKDGKSSASDIVASIKERSAGTSREHTSKTKVRTWKANLKV